MGEEARRFGLKRRYIDNPVERRVSGEESAGIERVGSKKEEPCGRSSNSRGVCGDGEEGITSTSHVEEERRKRREEEEEGGCDG